MKAEKGEKTGEKYKDKESIESNFFILLLLKRCPQRDCVDSSERAKSGIIALTLGVHQALTIKKKILFFPLSCYRLLQF